MLCNSVSVGSARLAEWTPTTHVSHPSPPVHAAERDPAETRESHQPGGAGAPLPGEMTISTRPEEVPPDSRLSRTRVGLETGNDAPLTGQADPGRLHHQ